MMFHRLNNIQWWVGRLSNALRVAICNTFDFLCVLIHIRIKGEVGAVKPV